MIILAGQPQDPTYASDLQKLHLFMPEAASRFNFNGMKRNRRGAYQAITTGVSHGNGSLVSSEGLPQEMLTKDLQMPHTLQVGPEANVQVVQELVNHPSMRRITGFTKVSWQSTLP